MTWFRLSTAFFSADPLVLTWLLIGGSFVVFVFMHIIAWCIDHFLPERIANIFHPVMVKIKFGLILLMSFYWLASLTAAFVWQDGERTMHIYILCIACSGIIFSLIMGIWYKDPHWVVLKQTTFSPRKVRITRGETIRFVNPDSGVTQRLYLDKEGQQHRSREFDATVVPGQALPLNFSSCGDYRVMTIENQEMVLQVRVSEPSPWHDPGI